MQIENIEILDFKNIGEAKLEFSPGVNCLVGKNGMGKSNLLEAIYFLSMARPMQSIPESALIRHGREQFLVKGTYQGDSGAAEEVSVGIIKGKGKRVYRNGKEYTRLSEHIGRFPIVAATPSDSSLVTESGEIRRRLMDMVISQTDGVYLSEVIRYNKALDSRNRMLRSGIRDKLLYESVESVMEASAGTIHEARRRWTEAVEPVIRKHYAVVSGGAEKVSVRYESVLTDNSFQKLLDASRGRDTQLGFTSVGIHRDDLGIKMNDRSLRRVGSQGQIKSFVIALRLAIYDYIRTRTSRTPILLLDDIFDKLDSERVTHIMEAVSEGDNFGQIFITDTNREHLDETIAGLKGESRLFGVSEGRFSLITH